jgi:hypothetical protein
LNTKNKLIDMTPTAKILANSLLANPLANSPITLLEEVKVSAGNNANGN